MSDKPELKPCPFCGAPEKSLVLTTAMGESWIKCLDCHASTEMTGTKESAVAAWNRRYSPPLPDIGPEISVSKILGVITCTYSDPANPYKHSITIGNLDEPYRSRFLGLKGEGK